MRAAVAGIVAALLLLTGCASPTSPALRVLCSNDAEICAAWAADFEASTGVAVQTVRLPSSEALALLQSGSAAEFDVWHGGPAELHAEAAEAGLLAAYEPAGAEAIPSALRDDASRWTGVYASALAICSDVSGLAALGVPVPESWDDLLDPRLAGRVSAPSPLASGTAFTTMTLHVDRLGMDAGLEHLSGLYANVMQFTRSGPAVANVVASGEALVGVTFAPYCEQHGAALATTVPIEGTAFELGAVAVVEDAPNPAAARAYVDHAVSAAGQRSGAASGIEQMPTRVDVEGDITARLAEGSLHVVPASTIAEHAAMRDGLLSWFLDEVGPGA